MEKSQTLFKVKHKDKIKKIPCTISNQMGSCVVRKSTVTFHEITFPRQIALVWTFGLVAFLIGMLSSSIPLTVILCVVFGILGYVFIYFKVIGRLIKTFKIDDIRSVTCTRVDVCLFFKDGKIFNFKMTPTSQARILNELNHIITNEYKRKTTITDDNLKIEI